jgi:hypothetical protein
VWSLEMCVLINAPGDSDVRSNSTEFLKVHFFCFYYVQVAVSV